MLLRGAAERLAGLHLAIRSWGLIGGPETCHNRADKWAPAGFGYFACSCVRSGADSRIYS
jgi:hypothetical protein